MMRNQTQLRIGLTYDLKSEYLSRGASMEAVAEFEDPETIDALSETLSQLGFSVDRIGNISRLVHRLSQNESWDLVFNIAEGMHGSSRESQIPCLLDAYQIPYVFSDAHTLSLCMNKAICKQILRGSAVKTADFFVAHSMNDLEQCTLSYPLFVKPVAEGSGKGINQNSLVHNSNQLRTQCQFLLQTFKQPVLIETYLSGEEYTVGILGTGSDARVLGVMKVQFEEQTSDPFYSLQNKQNYEDRVTYVLAHPEREADVGNEALKAWRHLGCRDGGRLDMRLDQHGEVHFIEVNPLAGLHPKQSDLIILSRLKNMSYRELLNEIVHSALQRIYPSSLPTEKKINAYARLWPQAQGYSQDPLLAQSS